MFGGERGIRTPDTLAGTHDFESCAFNQALPSLLQLARIIPQPWFYGQGLLRRLWGFAFFFPMATASAWRFVTSTERV